MYWPIGAPRNYAQQLPLELSHAEEDDTQESHRIAVTEAHDAHEGADSEHAGNEGNSHTPQHSEAEKSPVHRVNGGAIAQERQDSRISIDDGKILSMRVSRHGHLFATITSSSLTVWQAQPPVVISSIVRSAQSLKAYGPNVGLLLRPDGEYLVLLTSLGYLITYTLSIHPEHRPYDILLRNGERRRRSMDARTYATKRHDPLFDGGGLCPDAALRFRMVIKLDAGVSKALALDSELIVATKKPAAIQCIRWNTSGDRSQTTTELIEQMDWLERGSVLTEIVHDRPMNLLTFITDMGQAYAVQRSSGGKDRERQKGLFTGHRFHNPSSPDDAAVKAAINSRFSIIAVGCADGSIAFYNVRDYAGGISLQSKVQPAVSRTSTGALTTLIYSPDGYCLFAGYENGWAVWSVYGLPGGSSFGANAEYTQNSDDTWLSGLKDAFWNANGTDLVLLDASGDRLWMLEFARSAVAGCFASANIARTILQTSTGFMVYRGYQMPDLLTIAADISLWQVVKAPAGYLADQGPIRMAVMSSDGRYLAIAGQRGLAHYSFQSGRWRTFEDSTEQNSFAVRGGMCWHHHILIAATEGGDGHEIRLYSRESALSTARTLHVEQLASAVVHLAPSGEDSLLVYTNDNVLDHYIVAASKKSVGLIKVGQIALYGIIRSPPRVRAVSWVVPDHQLKSGEPSQDVAVASVFFLVDGKLVLLQPSANEGGELKYDMRVVAQNVEYYMLARDSPESYSNSKRRLGSAEDDQDQLTSDHNLGDSLWVFDGQSVKLWPDITQLLESAAQEVTQELQAPITIPLDFYPLSFLLEKGIVFGVEAELLQRRDSSFALFRTVARTALFLPAILQHYLAQSDTPSAAYLSHHYQHLPYFTHALEILLHNVLDEEVDAPSTPSAPSLLQIVLNFLSAFPEHYLSIIVQCARKTELRSWQTLFAHLPPPLELFEESLGKGDLKTAGGYLLVLHSLSEMESTSPQVIRLLRRAREEGEWELCKELARFLMALDESGATLREAMALVEIPSPTEMRAPNVPQLGSPARASASLARGSSTGVGLDGSSEVAQGGSSSVNGHRGLGLANSGLSPLAQTDAAQQDYFSTPRR